MVKDPLQPVPDAGKLTALQDVFVVVGLGLGALCDHVLLNKGCVPFLGLMMVFYGIGQAQIPWEAAEWVFLCYGQRQSVQHREAIPKPLLMI